MADKNQNDVIVRRPIGGERINKKSSINSVVE